MMNGHRNSGPTVVLHAGPAATGTGGMATVLATYAAAEWSPGFEIQTLATWDPADRDYGLRSTCAAIRRLIGLRIHRRRAVVHTHISEGGSFLRKGVIGGVSGLLGFPVVTTLHGADFPTFALRHPRLVRLVLARSTCLVVLAAGEVPLVSRYYPGPVHVVPNPTPPAFVDTAAAPLHPGSRKSVLFAGEVGERKGVDVLLRAWEKLNTGQHDLHLIIAGPDGGLVNCNPPAGCTFVGSLPAAGIKEHLQAALIAVLPSRREVYPMFLLEAMGSGIPWIASDVGAVAAIGLHGGGVVITPEDADGLADQIRRLSEDEALWRELSDSGRRSALGPLSTGSVVKQLESVYSGLLADRVGTHA